MTTFDRRAPPAPRAPAFVGETCILLHGKLRKLVAAGEWDAAADVGAQAFKIIEGCATCEASLVGEIARLCATLAPLGMLMDRSRLIAACRRVIGSPCSDEALGNAVGALRTAVGNDLKAFLAELPVAVQGGYSSPALLHAVCEFLDAESAELMLRLPGLASVVQAGLCSLDPAKRGTALALVGRMLVRAPLALCGPLVPILSTAALYESGATQVLRPKTCSAAFSAASSGV